MPETAGQNPELAQLDREIALQKNLTKSLEAEKKPVETLYTWEAPERDYDPKTKKWYLGLGIIALVFIAFAALTNNILLVFAIIALVVVIYTINTIAPRNITHQLTNKGLYTFDTLFLWKNMTAFWITQRGRKFLMHIEFRGKSTNSSYQTMIIMIGKGNLEKIVTNMVQFVDYLGPNEIDLSILTSWSQGKYLPLFDIVGDKDIVTKDPNDSPLMSRKRIQ